MSSFLSQFAAVFPLIVAGLIALALFGLFFKHAKPMAWSKLKGNHPDLDVVKLPGRFDNAIAGEKGDVLSSTPLAKGFAVVFAMAVVVLLSLVIGASSQSPGSHPWQVPKVIR